MNRLKNTRGYLCGAMDFAGDFGVGWRKHIKAELEYLGIEWCDPTDKPMRDPTRGKEEVVRMRELMMDKRYYDVKEEMDEICRIDERMVDISDFLIVYLDMDIPGCGTWDELFRANNQKKPILVIVKQGKQQAPTWLIGKIPHQHIFNNTGEVIRYLLCIAHAASINDVGRWIFFNFHGEKNDEAVQ